MDLKVFGSTFFMIFLAELGDKTQFAAMAASASTKSTLSVLLGVVLGLSVAGVLGVIAGKFLGNMLNPELIKWLSGLLFIAVGLFVLFKPVSS